MCPLLYILASILNKIQKEEKFLFSKVHCGAIWRVKATCPEFITKFREFCAVFNR